MALRMMVARWAHRPVLALPARASLPVVRTMATRTELAARAAIANTPFEPHVKKLFDTIVAGVNPMKSDNPGLRVERTDDTALTVHTGNGDKAFSFAAEPEAKRVWFMTPKTGQVYYYQFDAATGQWKNDKDKHLLIELFTRDLIYLCKGYPSF